MDPLPERDRPWDSRHSNQCGEIVDPVVGVVATARTTRPITGGRRVHGWGGRGDCLAKSLGAAPAAANIAAILSKVPASSADLHSH